MTLEEYARQWQAVQVHRASTVDTFDSHLRNHILPVLGRRPIASITRSEVQAFVKGRAQVLAPSTTATVYAVLRMVMRAAVADRLVGVSPCDRIALPKAAPREVMPLPHDAVAGLVAAVPKRYRALLLTAAGTGLRQGELFGPRRDRVDFLRRHIVVTPSWCCSPVGRRTSHPRRRRRLSDGAGARHGPHRPRRALHTD